MNTVPCLLCGFECKGLTLHLKYKHGISPVQYRIQFPNAEIFSKSVRQQMSDSSPLKGTNISFEDRLGKEKAEAAIAKSAKTRTGQKRPGQSASIKKTWVERRESWSEGIRKGQTPESREARRKAQLLHISKVGYHHKRGTTSQFEKDVAEALEAAGYTAQRQKGLRVSGTTRFFDFFIPSENLLIECDGEWWHRTPDRIEIDELKDQAAVTAGFKLLRLSSSEFSRKFTAKDVTLLLSLMQLDAAALELRSNSIIARRKEKLDEHRGD